ncbi:hypothetical protein [Sediminimonas sp.]|uniref:hypothetical protein n=1 Tax=Sediminimonas sp. TaxID=2823379 RepID=UPI0025DDDBE4|nr:hypothetical protein [Sediminimonas sp.]
MSGYQLGTGIKNQKRRQKIEDEQLAREAERFDWAREDREWTKSERERKRAAQQRARQRAEAERQRMTDAYDGAREEYETQGAPNPGRSIITQPDPNSDVLSGDINTPQPQAPQQEAPARRPRSINPTPPGVGQQMAPQQMPQPQNMAMPQRPQVDRTTPQAPARPAPRTIMNDAPQAAGGGTSDPASAPMPASFAQNPSVQEAAQSANMKPSDLWAAMVPQGRSRFLAADNPQGSQTPQQPAQPAAPSRPDMPSTPPERGVLARGVAGRNDPSPRGRAAPDAPQASTPGESQRPPVSPQDPPSVQAAAASAPDPNRAKGKERSGAPKFTPAQQKRATDSFMDFYAKKAVPKIVDLYLQRGDIEKAQAFEEWSQARETKGQLESWSKAVHAATIGDEDGLMDHLSDTYNAFDDGFDVVREQSGFQRGENGEITGARLTFRNRETGETFTRDYEDQGDLIQEGLYALAPENVFEMLWEQMQAAQKLEAEQAKKASGQQEDIAKKIIAEAARLRKQYTDQSLVTAEGMPSNAQITQEARDNVARAMGLAAQGYAPPRQEPPPNYTE